jgi:hypothetical protein
VVAVFHAVFDIAATTPTDTTLIPILMGAAVSLAGLAAIPALRTMEPSRPTGGVQCQVVHRLPRRYRVERAEPRDQPVVRALLRSPAHRVMSRGVLLLTYTGRRSGRRYTLPVQYARADQSLILWPAHHDRKRWWRNLQPPAPV